METVKGFRDYTGDEARKREEIRKIVVSIFEKYNFEPAETPIIEYEEFVRGNNQNDEAVSDTFKLKDKGERKLALRYELTFPLKRIAQNKKLPYRRYQIGPAFRDEPITGNRARQFISCDADIIGSTIKDEAEILKIAGEILERLKIKYVINVNNRKLLNEIMEKEKIKVEDRRDVIREVDKLDKLNENEVKKNLKKYGAEKILSIFNKDEKYYEKYESYNEIRELKKLCSMYKIKINFQPSLSRGLSYYNGTIFEIKSSIKETVCGGGAYIFNGVQGFGFGVSIERLELLANIPLSSKKVLIISLGQDKKAIELADKIRKIIPTQIFYGKPGKALDYANSYNIPLVIFIGDEEVKSKKFKLKNMKSGKEKMISEKDLEKELNKVN